MHPFVVLINRSGLTRMATRINAEIMHKDYEKLFVRLAQQEPAEGLFEKIIKRIRQEQQLFTLKRRIAVISFVMVCSMAAFIPVFRMMQSGLAESGFMEFFSLLSSDLELIMTYWQSFLFALLESLPIMSIAAFLGIIFIFIESLKFLTRDIKVVLKPLNSQ